MILLAPSLPIRKRARWARVVSIVALIALVSAGFKEASAEDSDALYKRGVALRKERKDAEALEAFKQLHEIEKSPRSLAQMGLAEQALGVWVDADIHLREALKEQENAWIKKNRATLEAAMADIDARLGSIDVWGEPAGAEVVVDGKTVGTLPLAAPMRAVAGNIPIVVRAPGYLERSTVVIVRPNETSRERIVLQREEAPTPAAAPSAATGAESADVSPSESTAATIRTEAPQATAEGHSLRRAAKWAAWGAGAVALGVGIFGTVGQKSAGSDFNNACELSMGTAVSAGSSGKTDVQCQNLRNTVDSDYRVEIIGLAAAGALAAAGFVLWLTEPSHGTESSVGLACVPGLLPGSAPSFGCALRF